MKKGVIITGVIVVALAAVVAVRVLRPEEPMEEAMVPVVEVQTPQTGTIELYRDLVGKVEPSDVVYIYPKMGGDVTEVLVKAGDMVQEGQVICRIDTKQVENAKLTLDSARIGLNDAQTNLSRQQALFAAGDISSAAFEQAQTSANTAKIQYDTAKLNYDRQVEYSNITATISGKVESFDVEVHDSISTQNLLAVIAGEGSKAVTFSVPEKIVDQLHEGDAVTITKNGSSYEGSITEISSMIDSSTGLFKIKATVDDGDALPTGSSVELTVLSDRAENVMTLPVDTIYYAGGEGYVYTYDNGSVHQIPVEVGIYDSEKAEVISGISADTQVITTWSSELFEGSQVQLAGAGTAAQAADAQSADAGSAKGQDAEQTTEAAKAE